MQYAFLQFADRVATAFANYCTGVTLTCQINCPMANLFAFSLYLVTILDFLNDYFRRRIAVETLA